MWDGVGLKVWDGEGLKGGMEYDESWDEVRLKGGKE